jgi:hypothetical protein
MSTSMGKTAEDIHVLYAKDHNSLVTMEAPKSPIVQEGYTASFVTFMPNPGVSHGVSVTDNLIVSLNDVKVFVVSPDGEGVHRVTFSTKYTSYNWTGYNDVTQTSDVDFEFYVELLNAAPVVVHSYLVKLRIPCPVIESKIDNAYDTEWKYTPVITGQIVTCRVQFKSNLWRHCFRDLV